MNLGRPFLINAIAAVMLIIALVAIVLMFYTKDIALSFYHTYKLDKIGFMDEDMIRLSAELWYSVSPEDDDDDDLEAMMAEEEPVVEEPAVADSLADTLGATDTLGAVEGAVEEATEAVVDAAEEAAEPVVEAATETAEDLAAVEDSLAGEMEEAVGEFDIVKADDDSKALFEVNGVGYYDSLFIDGEIKEVKYSEYQTILADAKTGFESYYSGMSIYIFIFLIIKCISH